VTGPASLPAALLHSLREHDGRPAQRWSLPGGGWETRTHGALRALALRVAGGLRDLGVGPGQRIGLVADNGPWWLAADLGILAAGAADVPRGSDSTPAELGRILGHCEAAGCVCVGEEATRRVLEAPGARERLRFLVRLDARRGETPEGVIPGEALLDRAPADPATLPAPGPEDVASVIYTSGTTGRPKGVTLLHRNFLHQLRALPKPFDFRPGDLVLVMLPPWHCFERIVEYVGVAVGGELAHSEPRLLKAHVAETEPTWMASVPRVWEMVLALSGHTRLAGRDPERAAKALRAALGGRLRCAVAGGGRVPESVDRAFNSSGIRFVVGYGLTETAPVLTVRVPGENRLGTVGRAVAETEIRIVDRENGRPLPAGGVGLVQARGPQVMRGYWKDDTLTARAIDPDGWFDTGDLGSLTPEGDLEFRGRAKDTIALRGGEKVEPQPIEDRLAGSPFVEQVVLVGQDRKVLGALLVPRREAAGAEVRRRRGSAGAVSPAEVEALLREESARLLTEEAGFMAHERVARVLVLPEPFTVENGLLTATLKVRRPAVLERYAAEIDALFGEGS
jgi:long-chain acyl-CoA synthetase